MKDNVITALNQMTTDDWYQFSKLIKAEVDGRFSNSLVCCLTEYKNIIAACRWSSIALYIDNQCEFVYKFNKSHSWDEYHGLNIFGMLTDIACCPEEYTYDKYLKQTA